MQSSIPFGARGEMLFVPSRVETPKATLFISVLLMLGLKVARFPLGIEGQNDTLDIGSM